MCGVAGAVRLGSRSADEAVSVGVRAMTAALAHRGPDDDGLWFDDGAGVALGHRRLAILDLSDAGHQPMVSASGRFVLSFNGEVYNYVQLRDELVGSGSRFTGTGDTEVLAAALDRWGVEETLRRTNGMFALAVWDRDSRSLLLARDRLGEKPIYYGQVRGDVLFASELSAFMAHPNFRPELDHAALADYVRLSYVPAPRSIYRGVRKLPPGCFVIVDRAGGVGEPVAYWSITETARRGLADPLDVDDQTAVDLVEDLLRESVSMRLASDVPLGGFLSGGVDSSLVVALMQAASPGNVRSFTVAVGGLGDEAAHAARVAAHLGTDHTTISLSERDAIERVPAVASLYDEPFADPSQLPVALMCQVARQQLTVAVSGDGGDEVFGGYNRYLVAHGLLGRVQQLPQGVRSALAAGLRAIPPHGWDSMNARSRLLPPDLSGKMTKLGRVLAAPTSFAAYQGLAEHWDPAQLLRSTHPLEAVERAFSLGGAFEDMLLADQRMTLPDDMLVKVDRASMSVGLEVRVPLLDHRLVELAWRLPRRMKVRGNRGKWVLREVLYRHVPAELVNRPKMGFDPPLGAWLRGPLQEWAGDLLSPSRLAAQGLFDSATVQQAWAAHRAGRPGYDYPLWIVLMAQSWLEASPVRTAA